jgi:hypothetical protein
VGPRDGLNTEARGKILSPLPGIELRSPVRPVRSQTLYCLSYSTHAHKNLLRNNSPRPNCMRMNRRNIIQVVKVAIPTFFLFTHLKYPPPPQKKTKNEGKEIMEEKSYSPTFY